MGSVWAVVLAVTSAFVVAVLVPSAHATPYEWLDFTYGADGYAAVDEGEGIFSYPIGLDSAGRAYVVVNDGSVDPPVATLRRLTADGALDASYAGGELVLPNDVSANLVDDAGAVTILRIVEGTGVVVTRYTAAGVLDTDFGTGGSVTAFADTGGDISQASLVTRDSGLIVFVHLFICCPAGQALYLVALTNSGDPDETWGSAGVVEWPDFLNGAAADGDAIVAINIPNFPDPDPPTLVRLTSTGELDGAFGTAGVAEFPENAGLSRIVVSGDDYYAYGSYLDPVLEVGGSAIARYSNEGDLDASFGDGGLAHGILVSHLVENPTDPNALFISGASIYLTGTRCCGITPTHVERFTMGGVLDTSYGGGDGEIAIDEIRGMPASGRAMGVQPGGQVLVHLEALEEPANEGDPFITHAVVVRLLNVADALEGGYVSLTPARILDTRNGTGAPVGKVAGNGTVELQVTGAGGVPGSGVAAVVLNVTVTGTVAAGHVTVFPTGASVPTASNLNFVASQTIANLVVVKLGTGGKVSLKNGSAGQLHLIADVAGYYWAGTPTEPGTFVSLDPARILDTRNGTGAPVGKVAGNGVVELQVTGAGGVPASGVAAVVVNVTVTGAVAAGHVTVFPTGASVPTASNLNFVASQTVPNLVVVQLGTGGKVSLKNGSAGQVHLIADVAGYYLAGTPTLPGTFVSLSPARILDTRNGTGAPVGKVAGNAILDLQVTGAGGVPGSGVAALVANVTVTGTEAAGHVTVFPTGASVPTASNLNFVAGKTVPNLTMVKLGTGGQVSLKNGSSGNTHLIADVAGYFLN